MMGAKTYSPQTLQFHFVVFTYALEMRHLDHLHVCGLDPSSGAGHQVRELIEVHHYYNLFLAPRPFL